MSFHPTEREKFLNCENAAEARRIISRLHDAGFVAYLAGGCVRDALLGRPPKDYDVATNATPDSVREVFGRSRTLAFGASFGVIGVLPETPRFRDSDDPPLQPTEVATFRSDGTYSDGRRPDSVHFGEAREDALRRDFTINGLFYDPAEHKIVDFVGGEADLKQCVIRTIGDATQRIEEDKLRMLRAVRFATTLEFLVDPETVAAISSHADAIGTVSGERIGAEMRRVLTSVNAPAGLRHLMAFGLHRVVLPELEQLDWDRYERISTELQRRDFPAALACLLVAMPEPLPTLREITAAWKLSNEESRQVRAALKHHMQVQDISLPWSRVQPILVDRDIDTIVALAAAVGSASGSDESGIERVREALAWPTEKLNPPPLLTGDDLRELGVPPGPRYRTILQSLRDAQLDGQIHTREQAIESLDQID